MFRLSLHGIADRFLAARSTKEFRRLVISMAILNFALATVALFEPIYLWQSGFSLQKILLFYGCGYALTFLLYPLGVRISARFGYHHSILFASPFLIAYYLSLYAVRYSPAFAIVSIFAFAMYIVLYWPNVHLECTREACDEEQGREMSTMSGIITLVSIAGPLTGGIIAGFFGFPILFAAASVMILLSNLPLMTLPERKDGAGFGYREALRNFLDTKGVRRQMALGTIAFGEDVVAFFIWPIALLGILGGVAETGAAVSLSLVVTTLALLFVGRISDKSGTVGVLRTGALFTMLAWIGRLLVSTPFGALAGDLFYRVARNTVGVPLLTEVYRAARKSDARKHIAFFEMRIFAAKALTCAAGIAILQIFPENYVPLFVFAAFLALFYAFMPKSDAS